MNQQPSIERQFFSEQNELTLYKILATNFQQQTGVGLNDRQQSRLGKALEHYMREVFDVNGPEPLPQLNREVLAATTKDFQSYLRRDMIAPTMAASQQIVSDPANQPRAEAAQQRLAIQQGLPVQPRPTFESNLLMDTGSRFEQMQQDRVPATQIRPIIPDFQSNLSSADTEADPLALFESAKKAREEEAARMVKPVAASNAEGMAATDANPLVRFMQPPSIQNDPQNNPTTAQPIAQLVPPVRGPLPQDYLIKQDDIINYKEVEYNLIVYSADRDWLTNTRENRYRFSVNFDVGNNKQGFYYSPSSNKKFKNISRIELVKVIIPTEGLIPLTQRADVPLSGIQFINTAKLNALTYPYIILRVPELDVNNYGTDDNLNNAFGILQYDANWYADNTNLEDGYLAMIPKFMKCQKVYQPTPLATLQKLTIELNTPEGVPLSEVQDTLSIQNIYISGGAGGTIAPPITSLKYAAVQDGNNNGEYMFIQTSTYFSKWQFAEGNRIAIQGLNPNQVPSTSANTLAAQNMLDYLQNPQGLPIIDIAFTGTGAADGANTVGYANIIIVRTPHVDPTTGSVLVQPFGGTTTAMTTLTNNVNGALITTQTYTGAKLINLTHQTNLVFRIITRELDPAARVRPDNL
jgi:hypothetical protein